MPDTTEPALVRTALVPGRVAGQHVEALGLRRDERLQVASLSTPDAYTHWLTGRATFTGETVFLDGTGRWADVRVEGTGTFAVGERRLIGIVDPTDPDVPALWLSWRPDVVTDVAGRDGATAQRPRGLTLTAPGIALRITGVAQVFGARYEDGRETHFLDALHCLPV